jgi:hypothetical protein
MPPPDPWPALLDPALDASPDPERPLRRWAHARRLDAEQRGA